MVPVASSFVPLAVDLFLFSQLISGPCTNTLVFQLGMDQHQVRGSTCGHRRRIFLVGYMALNPQIPMSLTNSSRRISAFPRGRGHAKCCLRECRTLFPCRIW